MIINTRPEKLSRELNYFAQSNNIEVTNIPLTEIRSKDGLSNDEIEALTKIETFDGIVFTSISACKYGLRKIQDFIEIAEIKSSIFAIGPATRKALVEHGLEAQIPEIYNSEGLAGLLINHGVKNILLVCGTNSESLLEDYLNKKIPKLEAYHISPLRSNINKIRELQKKSVILIFNLATFKLVEACYGDLENKNFIWICASQRIADYIDATNFGRTVVAKTPAHQDMLMAAI
ncbi:MAG: uroporphyrinogen-III synthase [Gammaproteobacteria bacterium]